MVDSTTLGVGVGMEEMPTAEVGASKKVVEDVPTVFGPPRKLVTDGVARPVVPPPPSCPIRSDARRLEQTASVVYTSKGGSTAPVLATRS